MRKGLLKVKSRKGEKMAVLVVFVSFGLLVGLAELGFPVVLSLLVILDFLVVLVVLIILELLIILDFPVV